jgi:signal transduction histidine kinase
MIRQLHRRHFLIVVACLSVLALGAVGYLAYRSLARHGPSYHDSFAQEKQDEWQAFGGTWQIINGAMQNSSDERGAKLMAGSTDWRDYKVDADVQLLGEAGDAGLVMRTTQEEEGVDSYHGYFAGLRDLDNTLILGRADYGWHEFQAIPVASGVRTRVWYHLTFLAYECTLAARTISPSGETTTVAIQDPSCVKAGRFGLQSYASGALWRNVTVSRSSRRDLTSLIGDRPAGLPTERGVAWTGNTDALDRRNEIELIDRDMRDHHSDLSAQPIGSLRLLSPNQPSQVTVHGVVTLISPVLYVQDATGGLAIPKARTTKPIQIGDAIEAKGNAELHDFSSVLRDADVRPLWTHTPVPPVAVSPSQAATGAFDAQYIEVEGVLRSLESTSDHMLVLTLDEGAQSFRAIATDKSPTQTARRIRERSRLRLRGVCVVDSAYTHDLTPFALLLPSVEEVEVIKGPPWWSTGHLVVLTFGFLLLLLAAQTGHSFIARWRLQAVMEEREQLAHEMHDTLAQNFAGLGFHLEGMRDDTSEENPLRPQLDWALDMVRDSHKEARRSVAALRPQALESVGLLKSLEQDAQRMVGGGSVHIATSLSGTERKIPVSISDTLLRIGQEAVANAVRHGQPDALQLAIAYENTALQLTVRDNGKGFDPSNGSSGFGIRGMENRAHSISADLEISSAPDEGTQVQVRVPIPPPFLHASWPRFAWQWFWRRGRNGRSNG